MSTTKHYSNQLPEAVFRNCSANIYSWSSILEFMGEPLFERGAIHFFRHGETYLNRKGLNSGQQDCPLTARGRMAAVKLADEIPRNFSMVFSSPLSRSIETMELAFDRAPMKPKVVMLDSRLAEKSLGVLESKPHVFIPEYDLGDVDYAPKNGETYRALAQRCLSFLLDLRRILGANKLVSDPVVVVFTHMGPLRVFGSCFGRADTAKEMMARKFGNLHGFVNELSDFRIPAFWADKDRNEEKNLTRSRVSKVRA